MNKKGDNMNRYINVKTIDGNEYSVNTSLIKLVAYRKDGQVEIHIGDYRLDTTDTTIKSQLEERA